MNFHYSRTSDLIVPDHLVTVPAVPVTGYRDMFGNWISRIVVPAGQVRLLGHAIFRDPGQPDEVYPQCNLTRRAGIACRNPGIPARQQVLRDGPPLGNRLEPVC